MIDTQADVSVIKRSVIQNDSFIDFSNIIHIKGVTNSTISSFGTTYIDLIFDQTSLSQEFHVVPDTFNIPVDAILGKDFLRGNNCIINYNDMSLSISNKVKTNIFNNVDQSLYIPPRCEVIRKFVINSPDECIVDNAELVEGIFISRTIVDPQNAYIRVLNTTQETKVIPNSISTFESLSNYDVYKIDKVDNNDERERLLVEILSENSSIKNDEDLLKLCTQYSDVFALKTDKMTINNFYTQSLKTTNDEPVYTKNYRTPHSIKDEINKQVQNLLENDLIEPSMSNFNSPIILVPKKDREKKNGDYA